MKRRRTGEPIPAPIAERALATSIRLNHILLGLLMEYTRTTGENNLSEAQTVRTHERERQFSQVVDMVADLIAHKDTPGYAERVQHWKAFFAEENRTYTRILNGTDLALINRVTEIVANEQRARLALEQRMDGQ